MRPLLCRLGLGLRMLCAEEVIDLLDEDDEEEEEKDALRV